MSSNPKLPGAQAHLTEHTLTSRSVFDGHLMKVFQDTVQLPNGKESIREYTKHPGAVAIIPVLEDGRLIMERQFRYPLHQVFLEFPAGKIDPDEDPLQTAIRELREETGYEAREFRYLTTIHPVISYSTEKILLYVATGLSKGQQQLDANEFLDVVEVEQADLMQQIHNGQVSDVKTIIGAFWLEKINAGQW